MTGARYVQKEIRPCLPRVMTTDNFSHFVTFFLLVIGSDKQRIKLFMIAYCMNKW